jgi:urease subunit alpha
MERTFAGLHGWPVNVGLQAGARIEDDGALEALLDAGACGFKIHEDYGAYPSLIDHVLRFADAHDVTVSLHTDGLHESAELEDTVGAIAGRTVHAYHVEGSGGGHVPGPARAGARGEHPVFVDHADGAVRSQRGGRGVSR